MCSPGSPFSLVSLSLRSRRAKRAANCSPLISSAKISYQASIWRVQNAWESLAGRSAYPPPNLLVFLAAHFDIYSLLFITQLLISFWSLKSSVYSISRCIIPPNAVAPQQTLERSLKPPLRNPRSSPNSRINSGPCHRHNHPVLLLNPEHLVALRPSIGLIRIRRMPEKLILPGS